MPCYSPLKGYKDEETGGIKFRRDNTKETMEVACGQCLGCRLDRSRMWAMRMVHEASLPENINGNLFCTLTYRNREMCTPDQLKNGEYIPESWSLDKTHIQKFMKRLRKTRRGDTIKYYHCGEYGNRCIHGFDLSRQDCPLCNVGRPHYHICLFNVNFNDLEPYASKDGRTYYTSPELESIWKYGFVDVGDLTMQSAGYVARYILKKVTGKKSEDYYERITEDGEVHKLSPEYATMSNGLGSRWYDRYSADVFPSDMVPVPGTGVIHKAPRYYEEKYKRDDPTGHELLKQKRIKYKRENEEEFTAERLHQKYRVKKAQVQTLSRELD